MAQLDGKAATHASLGPQPALQQKSTKMYLHLLWDMSIVALLSCANSATTVNPYLTSVG